MSRSRGNLDRWLIAMDALGVGRRACETACRVATEQRYTDYLISEYDYLQAARAVGLYGYLIEAVYAAKEARWGTLENAPWVS